MACPGKEGGPWGFPWFALKEEGISHEAQETGLDSGGSCFRQYLLLGAYFTAALFKEGKASQVPRFEAGTHKGAEFCAECHEEIFDQWSRTSAHSISTTLETYDVWIDKLKSNYVLNAAFGEKMCISCMGPPRIGVDCETCHGIMPRGLVC